MNESGVQFEDHPQIETEGFYQNISRIAGWVMKFSGGYVKSTKEANFLLFVLVIAMLCVSIFLFLSGGKSKFSNDDSIPPSPEDLDPSIKTGFELPQQ